MILIITNKIDPHTDVVIQKLQRKKAPFLRINTEDFPEKIQITWEMKENNHVGFINAYNIHRTSLSSVKAIWCRRPEKPIVSDKLKTSVAKKFAVDESFFFLQGLYTYLEKSFWINYPYDIKKANNKMSNLAIAAEVGLETPSTIITNDPSEARKFIKQASQKIIAKVLHLPIVGEDNNFYAIYSNIVTKNDLEKLDSVALAPTQLQEYIEKKLEVRVTIVGKKVFACEIHSQDSEKTKIDWRHYDLDNVRHLPHKLPKTIEDKLLKMLEQLRLNYGAFDLILTPEGKYVFLELNPNGQYLWIEGLTNLPISEAIAELLIENDT